MHEVVNLILADGNKGVPTVKACRCVAELVQAEVRRDACAFPNCSKRDCCTV